MMGRLKHLGLLLLLAACGPAGSAGRDGTAGSDDGGSGGADLSQRGADGGGTADAGHPGDGGTPIWHPAAGASWDWQLEEPVKLDVTVDIYDIDALDNDKSVMDAVHAAGSKVVCYVDVGSWESYRADAKEFPASVLGAVYSGYPNEKWLDIRQIAILAPIMDARFDVAQSKGCDGIEPDNMDGYDTTAHESSGFPLTYQDQLTYDRWVAQQVHARGMAVALKNDINQTADMLPDVDFAVSEQAFQYDEWQMFVPFITAGKPVLEAEYKSATTLAKFQDTFCPHANMLNFSSIYKDDALDAYRVACR